MSQIESQQEVDLEDLTTERLRSSPVWTWCYRNDLREDRLVSLPIEPVSAYECNELIVYARFRFPIGKGVEGCIVYSILRREVFAATIQVGENQFSLNKFLPDLSLEEIQSLAVVWGTDPGQLMPIEYAVVPKAMGIPDGSFAFNAR